MSDRVGFTASTFDLLHAGHVLMLREAASVCDRLVVAVQTDPTLDRPQKNKPVQSIVERVLQVSAVRYVDEVHVYDTEDTLLELLKVVQPDVRIIGEEYRVLDFTGRDWCSENDVEVYYNTRRHDYSSSELRRRIATIERGRP